MRILGKEKEFTGQPRLKPGPLRNGALATALRQARPRLSPLPLRLLVAIAKTRSDAWPSARPRLDRAKLHNTNIHRSTACKLTVAKAVEREQPGLTLMRLQSRKRTPRKRIGGGVEC